MRYRAQEPVGALMWGVVAVVLILVWLASSGCGPTKSQLRDQRDAAIFTAQQVHFLACLDGFDGLPPEECERLLERIRAIETEQERADLERGQGVRWALRAARPYAIEAGRILWDWALAWVRTQTGGSTQ